MDHATADVVMPIPLFYREDEQNDSREYFNKSEEVSE